MNDSYRFFLKKIQQILLQQKCSFFQFRELDYTFYQLVLYNAKLQNNKMEIQLQLKKENQFSLNANQTLLLKKHMKHMNKQKFVRFTFNKINKQASEFLRTCIVFQKFLKVMETFRNCHSKLAVLQARFSMELSMHPIIMAICFFIAAMHTWITVLYPTNQVIVIIKFLEPTMLIDNQIMLCVLAIPILLVSFFIVKEIFVSFIYGSIVLNTFQKYQFKIIGNLGWICCYAITLPVIRSSFFGINNSQGFLSALGWIILLLYTIILVPFYGLFLNDPSPRFGNSYAKLYYLDFIRLMPIIRLVMAYANVLQKLAHVSFVYIFLVLSVFLLLKQPILYYKFDRYHRKMIYLMLWTFMIRGTANINDVPIPATAIFMTAPIFVISISYLADLRTQRILYSDHVTVKKLIYFAYLLLNFTNNLKYTLLFVLYHKKTCLNPECYCRKLNSEENNENQQINHKMWNLFAVALIDTNFNDLQLDTLLASQKKKLLSKLTNIGIVKADVMANVLQKWNTTYYSLEKIDYNYKQQGWICHTFHAYRLRFLEKMTQHLSQACREKGTINDFASSYFQHQNQIQGLIISLQKSIQYYLQIWKQFQHVEPNSQKLLFLIKKNYRQCTIIDQKVKKLTSKNKDLRLNLMKYYLPYYELVCNTPTQVSVPKLQTVQKISEEMKRFSYDCKTCTSLIMISQGQQFGKILTANIHFELLTGFSAKQYLTVDSLIPFGQQKLHRNKMLQFLNRNQLNRESYVALIKLKNDRLKQVQLLIQLYPSVKNGLMACTFIFDTKEKLIFSYTLQGRIGQYNQLFKQQFEEGFEHLMKSYGLINRDQLFQLVENKQIKINLHSIQYQIVLQKTKHINKEESLYLCYAQKIIQNLNVSASTIIIQNQDTNQILQLNQEIPQQLNHAKSIAHKNEKQEHERQKLQDIFEIVNNEKSVKNITIWFIFMIFCFVLLQGLIIGCIVTIYEKQNIVFNQLTKKNDIQKACSNIVDSLYFFRKAHIAANMQYSHEEFQYNQMTFGELNKQVSNEFEKYNVRSYNLQGTIFNVDVNLYVSQQKQNYFIIITQKVLVSLTTFKEQTKINFDFPLRINEITKQNTRLAKNFIELNLNSIKEIVPKLKQFADLINQQVYCLSGQCIYQDPNVYLLPIVTIIFFIMVLTSCIISIKIKRIKYSTYNLLINLQESSIFARQAKAGTYIGKNPIYDFERNFMPDQNGMYNKVAQDQFHPKSVQKSKNTSVVSRFLTNINMQETQRQLLKQNAEQGQQTQKQFRKKKKKYTFPQFSIKKTLCKYSLLLIPCLILLLSIIILFYQSNYMVLNQIKRLDLLYQRLRVIKEVKLYNIQIGLEAPPNASYINEIMANQQLKQFINYLYNIERKIKSDFVQEDQGIGSQVYKFNQQNICLNLHLLSLKANFYNKLTRQQCQTLGQNYLTKGMTNTLVSLLQRSRQIELKYGKYNENEAQMAEFLKLEDLQIFGKIDYYLHAITIYEINYYIQEIKSLRSLCSTILLILILLVCGYSMFLLFIFFRFCRKSMFEDILQIKAIFHLISLETIRSSKTLSNIALKQNNYEFLK